MIVFRLREFDRNHSTSGVPANPQGFIILGATLTASVKGALLALTLTPLCHSPCLQYHPVYDTMKLTLINCVFEADFQSCFALFSLMMVGISSSTPPLFSMLPPRTVGISKCPLPSRMSSHVSDDYCDCLGKLMHEKALFKLLKAFSYPLYFPPRNHAAYL